MTKSTQISRFPILSSFWRLLDGNRHEYLWSILATCLIAAIEGILHPLLTKAIIDQAATQGNFGVFLYLIAGYLVLGLTLSALGYLVSIWQLYIDNKIVHTLSSRMLTSFYHQSYKEVLLNGAGFYVSRIRSDVKDGVVPFLSLVRLIAMNTTTFFALMSVLIFISWQAFLILAAIIPISAGISLVVGKKIRMLTSVEREREAGYLASLSRAISAFKIVRGFDLLPKTLKKHDDSMRELLGSGYKKFRVIRALQGVNDLTMVISDVCSLFVGALFVFKKQMTFGSYLAFMNAFWRSATTLMQVFTQWADLHSYSEIVQRVLAFQESTTLDRERTVGSALSLTDIRYAYGDVEVLKGFSLVVRPGERIMLTGRNGTGKTTLANVIAGYLEPTSGGLASPQNVASLTLPLSFPPLPVYELGIDRGLLAALQIDGAEIQGAMADGLSAGQMQKVALALALSRDSDVYVLDEPLANLDKDSEAAAMRLILERTDGKILLVIIHGGESYRKHFDRVVRLPHADDTEINMYVEECAR